MEKNIRIGDRSYYISSDDSYLDAMGDNFEPHMVNLFRTLIGADDVVADIGANIGLTAILFSSMARKVFAFEPSTSTYNILNENLTRSGVNNVETINIGLGDKAGTVTITFAKNNRSGGFVSDKIKPETGHVTEEIRIDTLDQYFANRGIAPNFLKIDVEGFEQNVIKGGGAFLQKIKPIVIMEMNHFCLNVLQRITIPDFLDYMRSVFPYLYAVDTDNATIVDLHIADQAYSVMHEHVVRHRFPNIVGGFDESIKTKLDAVAACGKTEEPAKVSTVVIHGGYNATLAEGVQFAAKHNYPSFIKSVAGMSGYETAGRWTEEKNVIFTFTQNLPDLFTLDIDLAGAFGPNIGKLIQIQVGDWKQQFIADAKPSNNKFLVTTSAPTARIEFTIPEPKSPKDLGSSSDSRQLGIIFKRLSIITN